MRRTKLCILIACMALIGGVLMYFTRIEDRSERVVGWIDSLDKPAMVALQPLREKRASDGVLLLNGSKAPYDEASRTYYLPQQPASSDSFLGRLEWSQNGKTACLAAEPCSAEAIAEGRAYTLYVSDGRRYFTESVVFTGMPILSIRIEQSASYVFDKGLPAGSADLFEPTATGLTHVSCYTTIRVRGNLSSKLPKVPYRLTLYDRDGNRLLKSLLGLPESDEWILNAMYSEPSRVRDKLALDTWNAIFADNPSANAPTASMEYVELFIDGAYMGLYGLINPVNERLLSLSDGDVLFKASEWERPSAADLMRVSDTLDGGRSGVSVKWPKLSADPSVLWEPMIRYVETFYDKRGEIAVDEGLAQMSERNLVDYALFFLVTSPRDNYFSNTYYLVRTEADGERRILKIPWDLNCTFGNCVTATTRTHCKQRYETSLDVLFPDDVETLLSQGETDLASALKNRYNALRKTAFSEEAMLSRLRAQAAYLAESGAMARELQRWPEGDQQPDITPIADFIKTHLRVLDEYFESAPGEESTIGISS